MNAEYRVCERCHGAGGSWELNLAQHLHSAVWVRCPSCGGAGWVVVRPTEPLTPEQQADIEKMLSTLDTPNAPGDTAEPAPDYDEAEQSTPDTPAAQGVPAEPPVYYDDWDYEAAERQAGAAAPQDRSAQGSVVATVPNPNRNGRLPMSKVLARSGGLLTVAALAGLAGFLWVQLDRAETSAREVEADLWQTARELDQQAAANGALELSLAESRATSTLRRR